MFIYDEPGNLLAHAAKVYAELVFVYGEAATLNECTQWFTTPKNASIENGQR